MPKSNGPDMMTSQVGLKHNGVSEWRRLRLDEPVIVLTCGRSGSTLLRLILDSHPELACPPETNIVSMCTRMGVLSMLLNGAPPTGEQPKLSELAAVSIRSWVTTNFGVYLVREGKTRWCEKSLGSAESAGRFLDLFPKAKYICLYRHCMDIVDSVLEACPFGVRGYGLDPFVAAHPGNSVAAVADYWVTHTRAIANFEQARPDVCLRVRYEDLVSEPVLQIDRIFKFLGEQAVPGITESFLARNRDPFGPSDHKVWSTSSINTDSLGRGARIPAEAIPPAVLTLVNGLLERLSYEQVGKSWGGRPDALVAREDRAGAVAEPWPISANGVGNTDAMSVLDNLTEMLTDRLSGRMTSVGADTGRRGGTSGPFSITLTTSALGATESGVRCLRVDPGTSSIMLCVGPDDIATAERDDWGISGDAGIWRSVLLGEMSFGTAVRHGHLRYRNLAADNSAVPALLRSDAHLALLTRLLMPT